VCVDNLNTLYYDKKVKRANVAINEGHPNFTFLEEDYGNTTAFDQGMPAYDVVCHLAAHAGVRNSVLYPALYFQVNMEQTVAFLEKLRTCCGGRLPHFVYASSSSVYGLNTKQPFSEDDRVDHPNSPYASTKRSLELYASLWARLNKADGIGLRFFTVYGPRGRPDMAPYKFMKAIHQGEAINVYGGMESVATRDYTFVDDIVDGVMGAIDVPFQPTRHEVVNLGNGNPVKLSAFVRACEAAVGKTAQINEVEPLKGDVPHTFADVSKAAKWFGYHPSTSVEEGLKAMYADMHKQW